MNCHFVPVSSYNVRYFGFCCGKIKAPIKIVLSPSKCSFFNFMNMKLNFMPWLFVGVATEKQA